MAICTAPCCQQPVHGRGLCQDHYNWLNSAGVLDQFDLKYRPLAGRACDVDGCDRPAKDAHHCSMHRERLRKTGQLGPAAPVKQSANQPCSLDGCETKAYSRGYCLLHYMRVLKTGDPGPVGRLRRPKGTGHITSSGYLSYNTSRNEHQADHQRVWIAANGPVPKGHIIHHKNGDKLDNRLENLELMTRRAHRLHHEKELAAGKSPPSP
jgi:hypothetical protein